MPHLRYRSPLCDFGGGSGNPPPPSTNNLAAARPGNPVETPEALEAEANNAENDQREAARRNEYEEAQRLQQRARELRERANRLRSASPTTAGGGSSHHGCNCSPLIVHRNEQLIARALYLFLLGTFIVGGISFLAWLVYSSYAWGYHSNPCKPPCSDAVAPRTTPQLHPPADGKGVGGQPAPPPPQPRQTTARVTVAIPGLEKTAADLKAAAEKLAAPQPTVPGRLDVRADVEIRHNRAEENFRNRPEPEEELSPEELERQFKEALRRKQL